MILEILGIYFLEDFTICQRHFFFFEAFSGQKFKDVKLFFYFLPTFNKIWIGITLCQMYLVSEADCIKPITNIDENT